VALIRLVLEDARDWLPPRLRWW